MYIESVHTSNILSPPSQITWLVFVPKGILQFGACYHYDKAHLKQITSQNRGMMSCIPYGHLKLPSCAKTQAIMPHPAHIGNPQQKTYH